jgi:hypothetical protein
MLNLIKIIFIEGIRGSSEMMEKCCKIYAGRDFSGIFHGMNGIRHQK